MKRYTVVFDLDDTLYPERQWALSGFRAAERWAEEALGLDGLAADMTRLLDEGHRGRIFDMVLAERMGAAPPETVTALVAAYRANEPELTLFDDAQWVLDHLAPHMSLGLVTDGEEDLQSKKITALGIAPRFDSLVITGALGPNREFWKPHPKPFETVASRLPQDGRRLVYVGDNPSKDFVSPNAMGWLTVQIVRPGGIHDGAVTAEGGAPAHMIESLRDLPAILTGMARDTV
ncbi:MAG: HAD family hydrolase [Hyphomicrobiaceae bacterium]